MKKDLQPYFKNVPKDRLNRLKELHSLILKLFPSAITAPKGSYKNHLEFLSRP